MDRMDILWLLLRHTPDLSEDETKGVRGLRWRLQEGSWHECAHFKRCGKGRLWLQPTVHKWVLNLHDRDDTILPAPFIFGNWTTTSYCNETCGTNRFKLELRTCNLVNPNPNLPSNISCQNQLTLRTGDSRCLPSKFNCTGKIFEKEANLLMWHYIKVTSSSGQRGVTVTQIAARASRPSEALRGSLESGAGTEATQLTSKVSSKLRSNLASLTAHQVGD